MINNALVNDANFIAYILLCLISILGVSVILWKWTEEYLSVEYRYIGLLFAAIGIRNILSGIARYYTVVEPDKLIPFLRSVWWISGRYLLLGVMVIVVAHLGSRMVYKRINGNKRRQGNKIPTED
jgi:hypothetical protein